MSKHIVPWFGNFPFIKMPTSLFDEENDLLLPGISDPSGLSLSEDDKCVYVDAALPGLSADEIEMTFCNRVLSIQGSKKEETENKKKKIHRKAETSFSYRVLIPAEVEESPKASLKNGVLKITFSKTTKASPKKIQIKED